MEKYQSKRSEYLNKKVCDAGCRIDSNFVFFLLNHQKQAVYGTLRNERV
jgi:hypothetical protein